jgi:hypothetical protein
MEAKYLFVILTIGLTLGFFGLQNTSSIDDVINHWSERRCDFDVILLSFMYKPADDKRSASDFATDNLKFCVSSKSTNYLNTIFGVLYELLRKQFDASKIMTQVMKVLRAQLNTIYAPFSLMMKKFWVKFTQIGSLASRIFQHTYMAMKKAAATAIASIYIALSVQAALLNTIDLVINIIMIVLYILLGLIVVFFLPILPLLVIVLITVPGKTGAMGSLFCFSKDSRVILKDSSVAYIDKLKPGDLLYNDNVVQAVVEVPGEELYNLEGVLVSGFHSIYDSKGKKIYVKDYPKAFKSSIRDKTLWTLVTSKREIYVQGINGPLSFLDWDEIPDTDKANKEWDILVGEMLNGEEFRSLFVPKYAPCLDNKIKVLVFQSGWKDLSEINIGDWIMDNDGWTRVTGKAHRRVGGGIGSSGNRLSDGSWFLNKEDGKWTHPLEIPDSRSWEGVQLITSSGNFKIKLENGNKFIVRDFTEVGSDKISESDVRIETVLKDVLG